MRVFYQHSIGYTGDGLYRREDKLKIQTIHKVKLNTTLKNQQKTQQNKTTLVVAFYDTWPENRWAYSTMLLSSHWAGIREVLNK